MRYLNIGHLVAAVSIIVGIVFLVFATVVIPTERAEQQQTLKECVTQPSMTTQTCHWLIDNFRRR